MNRSSCGLLCSVAVGLVLFAATAAQAVELGVQTSASGADLLTSLRVRYILHNANAADTTNAEDLWSGGTAGLSLTGAGVVVGIWDGGSILDTHQEFASVSITNNNNATPTHVHSTHVAGTIAAQGLYPAAKGMASGVTIQGWDFYDDRVEMRNNAATLHISNHSYGSVCGWHDTVEVSPGVYADMWWGDYSIGGTAGEDSQFGLYNAASADIDDILADNPNYLSVWSAGNDRNDSFNNTLSGQFVAFFTTAPATYVANLGFDRYLVRESDGYTIPGSDGNNGTGYDSLSAGGQTAKNTLVVGAVYDHLDEPQNGSAVSTAAFSSYGGTDDGRLGVHVVANGVSLTSTSNAGTNSYIGMSGTSMAAPNATGTLALLHEHYQDLTGGSIPTSATQKAYVIHAATDVINAAIGGQPGPDYATGYGLINGLAAAEFLTSAIDGSGSDQLFENTLTESATFSLTGLMATDSELKATLVWTDPAGTAQGYTLDNRTPVLVNNLDLWLTDGSSTIYYPWTLDIENPADAATTGVNSLDVVEQVALAGITPGSLWSVHVGHQGSLAGGSQEYSLLFSGLAIAIPEPASLLLLAFGSLLLAWRRPRR